MASLIIGMRMRFAINFFFQAEDGIRDLYVTGVQTCALPISEDILRRALKRAGIVTGWKHVCRRKGCGHSELRSGSELHECPKCGMKLWPKGLVRHIRFHDLRHTYGSVLLMFGANLVSVQRLLGHSDPRITERRYGHLLPDFMKSEVDRLRFGIDALAPSAAPLTPTPSPRP